MGGNTYTPFSRESQLHSALGLESTLECVGQRGGIKLRSLLAAAPTGRPPVVTRHLKRFVGYFRSATTGPPDGRPGKHWGVLVVGAVKPVIVRVPGIVKKGKERV